MKTCLVQAAAGANVYNGLGNGLGGPSILSTGGTETLTGAQVTIDEAGTVRIVKAGLTTSVINPGDSFVVSAGQGILHGVFRCGGREGADTIIVDGHRSAVLPQIATYTYSANPADNDTFLAGGLTYRFKTVMAAAYDIQIGANAKATFSSLLLTLSLTGTAGTDFFAGTTANPFWKPGRNQGVGNAGNFQIESRLASYRMVPDLPSTIAAAAILTQAAYDGWYTCPAANSGLKVNIGDGQCSLRLVAARNDIWSARVRAPAPRKIKAVALAGTSPTITLYSGHCIGNPVGATSGPLFGLHDLTSAAPALALPIGIEVDLGTFEGDTGGILFRVLGTNPVVLISFD